MTRTRRVAYLGIALAAVAAPGVLIAIRYGLAARIGSIVGREARDAKYVVSAPRFFHEELAEEVGRAGAWNACPMIVMPDGDLEVRGKSAGTVVVYGVDQRFWSVNRIGDPGLKDTEAFLSAALGKDYPESEALVLRLQKASTVSPDSVYAPSEKSLVSSLSSRGPLDRDHMGEFSLRPGKGTVRAVFLNLATLQNALGEEKRANTLLIRTDRPGSEVKTITRAVRERVIPADLGLQIRQLDGTEVAIESDAVLISEPLQLAIDRACSRLDVSPMPVLSGIANSIGAKGKSIPYSFVAAVSEGLLPVLPDKVVLTDWAARDLRARPGDPVTFEVFVRQSGAVTTKSFTLPLERVIPMKGIAVDENLAPDYPGITEAESLRDWNPPFPFDTGRIRPQDERYWTQYRTAPKAFVSLSTGKQLWGPTSAKVSSVRANLKSWLIDKDIPIAGLLLALQAETDPLRLGYSVQELPGRWLWP